MDVGVPAESGIYTEDLGIDLEKTGGSELFSRFLASYVSGESLVVDGGWTSWR